MIRWMDIVVGCVVSILLLGLIVLSMLSILLGIGGFWLLRFMLSFCVVFRCFVFFLLLLFWEC